MNGHKKYTLNETLFSRRLDASLPPAYDFAVRLFGSPRLGEQALKRALHALLSASDDALATDTRFLERLCAETLLLAEAEAASPRTGDPALVQLSGNAPASAALATAATIWEAAAALPLQEYCALHLQIRAAWDREAIARCIGVTPAYAFVLLDRSRRHFEGHLSAALLLRENGSACEMVASLRKAPKDGSSGEDSTIVVAEHLAGGCSTCGAALASFGDLTSSLAYLTPVSPPAGLSEEFGAELAESIEALPTTRQPAATSTGAGALAVASSGAEPGLRQTRLARSRRWLEDRHIPVSAVAFGALSALLIVLSGLSIYQGINIRRLQREEELARREAVIPTDDGADAGLSRPSAPITGRLPEGATSVAAPPSQVAGSTPEAASEPEPIPRLTATPQNRAAPPVVILNPIPTARPISSAARSELPEPAATAAAPTATPVPTPIPPRLGVSASNLNFLPGESTKTVVLSNTGAGELRWSARPERVWIVVSPSAGTIGSTSVDLQVFVDNLTRGQGRQTGSVTITSNAGNQVITVTAE